MRILKEAIRFSPRAYTHSCGNFSSSFFVHSFFIIIIHLSYYKEIWYLKMIFNFLIKEQKYFLYFCYTPFPSGQDVVRNG